MRVLLCVMATMAMASCIPPNLEPPDDLDVFDDDRPPAMALELIHSGLEHPTELQAPHDGTGRLFIVEQRGTIRISSAGVLQAEDAAFLDIRDRIADDTLERGLVALAFHPQFADNGRFFVNYTQSGEKNGDTVIAEFTVSDNPDQADPTSERVLLELDQPAAVHNGAQMQFGPDGMLYVGTGDGGPACDPSDNAQNPATLFGKILRLDVDNPESLIPADNPLVNEPGARGEIWALGFRNPWRFSFDEETGLVYIGDVGQAYREEVNVVPLDVSVAPNFGWRTYEGTRTPPLLCEASEFEVIDPIPPLIQYSHNVGCAVAGGYVYRGSAIPELRGVYLYSDYCTAFLGAARVVDGAVATLDITDDVPARERGLSATVSFGRDEAGELYLLDRDGDVFKLVPDSGV